MVFQSLLEFQFIHFTVYLDVVGFIVLHFHYTGVCIFRLMKPYICSINYILFSNTPDSVFDVLWLVSWCSVFNKVKQLRTEHSSYECLQQHNDALSMVLKCVAIMLYYKDLTVQRMTLSVTQLITILVSLNTIAVFDLIFVYSVTL